MGKQRSKADIPVNVSAYSLRDVNETLVENRLRDSGFKNVPKSTVQSIVARGGIASKDRKTGEAINIPVASLPTQKTYESIKGDVESASELFFQGLTDIPVSVSAGIQQMLAGTDKQKLDAIRKWQDDNTNQISFAAKRMLENEEMSIEKFMFTAGNTVGQIVSSMATAAAGTAIGAAAGTAVGGPVGTVGGAVGGFLGGMAVNMPFMYNSLLNSARDAGISDADAVGYAYGTGIGLAALESVPLAKIAGWTAKSVAPSLTKSVLGKMANKYGAKNANELIERIGADKFNKEVAVGVYKAARNGIADRVIGKAGAVGMGALAEGGQEITEFYLEKLAQATYDSTRGEGKQSGKGAFGTQFTQEEFFGKKARDEAFWNGVFGAVGGGFAGTVQAVSSPLYKTGVYDTIDTFVKRGKTVDEAVAALNGIIDRRIGEGELAQDIADTAKSAIQNVAQSYNKIGGKFDEPEFRYVVYERISKKDDLVKELGALESKKAEIQGIIAQNQGDADIYTVDMMEIDKLIDQKQRQLDFTSTWLKDYTQKYYDNKKAKNTAQGQFVDDSISDFIVRTDSFDKKKQTPYEFAKEANDAYNAGMKEIDLQYDPQVKSMDITSLNENVNQDFDEIDTIKTKVRTNPSSSENLEFADVVLATDEDGNIAVRRESIIDGQSKVDYIPIANTPQYEPVVARAKSYFENRDSFEGIASKLVLGQELTEDEAELYEDFADNIDGYKEEMERAANFNANLALAKMFAKPIKEALQGMAPTIQRYQDRIAEIDETLARDENIPASNQDLNSTKTNEKLSANEIAKLNQNKQALLAEIEKYNQELQRVTEMNPDDSPLEELNSKELALYQTRMAEVDILFNEMVEKFLTNKASNLDDFYGTYGQYGFLRNMEEYAKSIAAQKRLFKDSYNPEVANTINKIIDKARILEAKMQEVRAGIEAAKQKQEEAKAAAEQIKLEKQKAKEAEKILKEANAKLDKEKKKKQTKKGESKKEDTPQEQEVQEEATETVAELEQVVKEAGDIIIEAANNIEQIRGELTNEQQLPTDSTENESGVQPVQTPTAPISGTSETTLQENVTQGESTPEGEGTTTMATDATESVVPSGSDDTASTQGGSTQTQLPNVSGDVKTQEEKVSDALEVLNSEKFNELSSSDVDMPSLDNKSADSLESLLAQKQELLKGNLSPEDRQLVQDQIAEIEGQIKQKAIENNEIVTDTKPEVQALNAYNNIPDVAIKVKIQDTKGLIKVTKGKLGDSLNDETRNVIISDIKQVGDKIQVTLYGDENVVSLTKNSENKVIASNQFNEPITVKMNVDEFVSMFIFGNSSELQRRATLENLGITEKSQSEGTVTIPKGTNVQIAYELGNEVKGKSATLQKSLKIDSNNYKLNTDIGLNTGAIVSITDATGKVLYQRGATTQQQEQVTPAQQEAQSTQQGSTDIQNQLLEIKRNGSMTFDSGSQKFFNRFVAGIERIFPGVSIGVLSEQDWIDSGLSPSSRGAFNRKTGQVMLRESMYDGSTFVHEVGHAIMKIIGDVDTNLYNAMLDAVEDTKYEAYVRDNYPNLTTREEILSEAMGYAIQDKGVKMQSRPMAAFRDMMTKAFNAIKKFMGYRTNKDIGDMTLDDFTSEVAGIMFGIKDADIFLDEFDLTQNAELNNYFETEGYTDESSIQYQYFKFQANQQQVAKGVMRGSEYATFAERVSAGEATMQETIGTLKSIVDSPILESQMASALTTGSGKDKFDGYSFIKANLNDFATDYYNIVTNTDAKNLTPLQNSDIVELGNTMLETYADQHKMSHIEVVQDGKQVQVFVDPAKEASNVNKNVRSFFDAARAKGIMAKYTAKFLTGSMFSNLSNMDTVAQMLSGDNGIMKGIQDLRVHMNKVAARVHNGMRKAIYDATEELTQIARNRGRVSKLKEGNFKPLEEEVNVSFHNNFTGDAELGNSNLTLGQLAYIYLARQTQVDSDFQRRNAGLLKSIANIQKEIDKAKKIGNSKRVSLLTTEMDAKQLELKNLKRDLDASDIIYDPIVKDGSHLSKYVISNNKRTNRGISFELENEQKVTILLTRDQMKVIDDMFEEGGKYEEEMKVLRRFWSSDAVKNVFIEANEVKYRIEGGRAQEVFGTYIPIRKDTADSLSETSVEPNVKNMRFVLERTGLAGRIVGLDMFSIMNEYMEQNTEYIANAEYRDSLRTYRNSLTADDTSKNRLVSGADMEIVDAINTTLKGIDDMVRSIDSGLKSRRDANRELDKAGIPHRIYNLILSNFSKAVFSFNLGNLFKQSAGYLAGLGQGIVNDEYIYREVGYIGKIIPASMKTYITNDGKLFGKDFNGFFKVKAIEREMEYLEKHEYHFADILRRIQDESAYTGNIELDSLDFVLRKKGKLGDVYRAANKTIFKGLSAMRMNDAAVIIAFVRAARAEVTDLVRNGKLLDAENNPITDVESPKALRLIAEKASELVYRTNNMYMENDKTPLQRSNNILHKSIGLFSSQPQKISNLFAQRFMSAAQDGFKNEEKNKTMRSTMVWAMLAGATLQSSITIMYGILRNGYDEEREYELDFFYEFIRNFTGMFPSLSVEVLNGLLSALDNAPWTGDIASNPVFSLLENAIKATAALKESMDEDKPEFIRDRKYQEGVRQGADALAKIFGAPTVAVNFIVKQALLEDKK